MIEANIVEWLELGESIRCIEVYESKNWTKFFSLFKMMMSHKKFSLYLFLVLKFLFFLQIIMLNLTSVDVDGDYALTILNYVSNVLFTQTLVNDTTSYNIAFMVVIVLMLIIIFTFSFLYSSVNSDNTIIKLPIELLNFINVLILHFLYGPVIQVTLISTQCSNGIHDYLQVKCYTSFLHALYLIISAIAFLVFVVYTISLSIYYHEIGAINHTKIMARNNTSYEIFITLWETSIFIFSYFIKSNFSNNQTMKIIYQIYLLIVCCSFFICVYINVYYYNLLIYNISLYGWLMVSWFSFVVLMKMILDINNTLVMHIVGWIVLIGIVYFYQENKQNEILTNFNIFGSHTVKELEIYIMKLYDLLTLNSLENEIMLVGILNKFKEDIENHPEIKFKYDKLLADKYLNKKFTSQLALKIYSLIYIIYHNYLDKAKNKEDILIHLCYFLINKFKNVPYAIYLCSKVKARSHLSYYYKFTLMEEIKEYISSKLSNIDNKGQIKKIQIGSVILYNIYVDLFKQKIINACCQQADYFEFFKNQNISLNATAKFLKVGEDILESRTQIIKLWNKLIEINPFSEEIFINYGIYLSGILQDELLYKTETKKYNNFKQNKIGEITSLYSSLFNKNSSIILVDGFNNFGNIIYSTLNFNSMFNFSKKEIINLTINDLVPEVVKEFHDEIVEHSIKYSNLSLIFNSSRDFLLKSKTQGLYNIHFFVKTIPNLKHGLIYIANIERAIEHSYTIILDKNFNVNGFSDSNALINNNSMGVVDYLLQKNIINNNIGLILPEILPQLEYTEATGFSLDKDAFDFKGILYCTNYYKTVIEKLNKVLDFIKLNGKLELNDEAQIEARNAYEDLNNEIDSNCSAKYSIFYKIDKRTFLNKYCYYRLYISKDLVSMNDSINGTNSIENLQKRQKQFRSGVMLEVNKSINSKENKIPSTKQIKLKIGKTTSGEENNLLLKNEEHDIINDFAIINKQDNILDNMSLSQGRSQFSRTSIDSASFNRLKGGILEKREVSSIRIMRYLILLYSLASFIIIITSSFSNFERFSNINEFLQENYYFNKSKIYGSCVYLSAINLKLQKLKVYNDTYCVAGNCTSFHIDLLTEGLSNIKYGKNESNIFFDIYKAYFKIENTLNIYRINLIPYKLTTSQDNFLSILIVYSLELLSIVYSYLNDALLYNDYNAIENIINISALFTTNDEFSGLTLNLKAFYLNSSSLFASSILKVIIAVIMFLVLAIFFSYFTYSLYKIEYYYLGKLLRFKNSNFEIYLKNLEEIKKKIKQTDFEEEEAEVEEELIKVNEEESFENSDKKEKKLEEQKKNKKLDKKLNRKKDKKLDKESKEKKETKKERKNLFLLTRKGPKIKTLLEEKHEIYGKYFLKLNIFFIIKVLLILLITMTYYLTTTIIDSSQLDKILFLDNLFTDISSEYSLAFSNYIFVKTELYNYLMLENEKKLKMQQLIFNSASNVNFQGKDYSDQISLSAASTYTLNISSKSASMYVNTQLNALINSELLIGSSNADKLNTLYNINACDVLFNSTSEQNDYLLCSTFWSNILSKGMDQSLTQMVTAVTSIKDDFYMVNNKKKDINQILVPDSNFNLYEQFVSNYLFKAYKITIKIFAEIFEENILQIKRYYNILMIVYVCLIFLLCAFAVSFIHSSKAVFNSFLNFIGIVPSKFLIEDHELYREILKLDKYIYY